MSQQQRNPWVTVGYEVQMFRCLLARCDQGTVSPPELTWEVKNAITESLLLHLRQLADILLSCTTYASDIKLKDILPGFLPTRLEELRKVYNGGIREVLNKFAMHPSTLRTEYYDYTSEVQQLSGIIEHVIREIETRRGSTALDWMDGGTSKPALTLSNSPMTNVPTTHAIHAGTGTAKGLQNSSGGNS